jgi:hypothetical protein
MNPCVYRVVSLLRAVKLTYGTIISPTPIKPPPSSSTSRKSSPRRSLLLSDRVIGLVKTKRYNLMALRILVLHHRYLTSLLQIHGNVIPQSRRHILEPTVKV